MASQRAFAQQQPARGEIGIDSRKEALAQIVRFEQAATGQLNVHHKFPFHYVVLCGRPDLELDTRNLITLCVRPDCQHHLPLGHLDDYESYNRHVQKFVKIYAGQTSAQIRSDAAWQKAHAARPKHLDRMTQAEKDNFKHLLDRLFIPKAVLMAKAMQATATLNP